MPEGVRFDKEAVALLGHSLETMLTCYFHRGLLRAKDRKRKSGAPQDLSLWENFSGDDAAVEKSLLATQQAQTAEAMMEQKKDRSFPKHFLYLLQDCH